MRETIILLPGLLCDASVWEHQVRHLGREYDVHVPDLRHFDTIAAMARHVLEEAPERFSLAGHSMGARVALEMVRMAADRIDRLALLDTGIHPVRDGEADRRQALIELGEREGMEALARVWLPPMVSKGRLDIDAALRERLHAMVQRMDARVHRNHINALLGRPDANAALAAVRCPVLVGVGSEDAWSPPAQHEEIVAALPGAVYQVFEGSGHMAPMESPEAVTEALKQWMALPLGRGVENHMTREVQADASPSMTASPSEFWAIERAIVSQIHRFAQANDAHDHDALAEMFTPDGSFARPTAPEAPVSGREAIRAFFRDRPARRTRHVMANIVVDLLSPVRASARSYVVLYSGERGENVLVGDFEDELRLEPDGIWRFSRRSGSLAFDY
ncbi:alpha/beta fold hydrolase [Novosphingobium sp. ZW T3_23]|uniref:alpha/beta fold hydrolase n=1 Tax=Novosphingobium sp. ZW T3_23 TaxID=3378084 RepID=UPI0038536FF2